MSLIKEFLYGLTMPFTVTVATVRYGIQRLRGYDPYKVPSGNGAAFWMGAAHFVWAVIVFGLYLATSIPLVLLCGPIGFAHALGATCVLCGLFMLWAASR